MKKKKSESVVQEWVFELPFMMQALLLTAMRGPDGCPKYNNVKNIVRFIRGTVLKPAGKIYGNEDGFMWIDFKTFDHFQDHFFKDTDQFPMHFLMHLFHASEVIGYKHPDETIRLCWNGFYQKACEALHMVMESEEMLDYRLNK